MFFYIILAFLAILVSSLYWTPKLKESLIKKANPQLLEKVITGSDGSLKGNQQIKQTLIAEGNSEVEVSKAIAAATVKRQNKNQSKSVAIMGIMGCLILLSDVLLSPINITRGIILVIALVVTFYAYKHSEIKLFKK